jgi:hypothetical protein
MNWVTVKRFCELSGYSVDAVDQKRASGVWLRDQVWKKAPDNRILISIRGYEEWVEGRASVPQRIFYPAVKGGP